MGLGGTLQTLKNEGVLVFYHDYRLGHFLDLSGNGYNGTPNQYLTFQKKSIQFTSSAGAITVADSATLRTTTGALICRCSPGHSGVVAIASKYSAPNMQIYWLYTGTALELDDTGAPYPTLTLATKGMQTHAVNFNSGGTPTGYMNGVSQGSYSGAWTSAGVSVDLSIGNYGGVNAQVNQRMEYFLWFSRELTATEHADLYYDLQRVR